MANMIKKTPHEDKVLTDLSAEIRELVDKKLQELCDNYGNREQALVASTMIHSALAYYLLWRCDGPTGNMIAMPDSTRQWFHQVLDGNVDYLNQQIEKANAEMLPGEENVSMAQPSRKTMQ